MGVWPWASLLVMTAAFVAACGGGDGRGPASEETNASSNGATPVATGPAPRAPTRSAPTDFESARDDLFQQLDAIGVNIGVVPDDIRAELVASCRDLGRFADVGEMCDAIAQAIDNDDPGLIDLVLDQLAKLQAE